MANVFNIIKTFSLWFLEQDLVIILETMRIIAIALSPISPGLCWKIYSQLGFSKDQFDAANWVSLSLPLSLSICILYTCLCAYPYKLCNLSNELSFVLQSETKWGGLKGGQVMAQPKPVFARIENQTEAENGLQSAKKVVKRKEKSSQAQRAVEA